VSFFQPSVQTNGRREIIDESDVFVDVHKAIRRMHPVSYYRIPKAAVDEGSLAVEGADLTKNVTLPRKLSPLSDSQARGPTAKLKRRRSSGGMESIAIRNQDPQLRRHLSHLGPSNLASAPKQTRINTVKIKPAHVALSSPSPPRPRSTTPDPILSPISPTTSALQNEDSRQSPNPETSLLSAGYRAGDAVRAVNYGTLTASPKWKPRTPVEQLQQAPTQPSPLRISEGMYGTDHGPQSASKDPGPPQTENTSILIDATDTASYTSMIAHAGSVGSYPAKFVVTPTRSVEQISLENESLEDENESRQSGAAGTASPSVAGPSSAASAPEDAPSRLSVARSGSIFERGLEVGGVPKVVLDVHDDQLSIRLEDTAASATGIGTAEGSAPGPSEIGEDRAGSRGDAEADAEPRKKRRRRYKKKKPKGGPSVGEDPGSADGGVAL
jgi:metal transporter CNNM